MKYLGYTLKICTGSVCRKLQNADEKNQDLNKASNTLPIWQDLHLDSTQAQAGDKGR